MVAFKGVSHFIKEVKISSVSAETQTGKEGGVGFNINLTLVDNIFKIIQKENVDQPIAEICFNKFLHGSFKISFENFEIELIKKVNKVKKVDKVNKVKKVDKVNKVDKVDKVDIVGV